MPVFDSTDAANELIGALIMGLWNRLTRHQDRNSPFRLNRIETAPTREGLADLLLMRVQEIDGFVAGLFGREDRIDLPERAHRALDDLAEIRALVYEARGENQKAAESYRKVIEFIRQHPDAHPPGFEDPFVTLVDRLDPPQARS